MVDVAGVVVVVAVVGAGDVAGVGAVADVVGAVGVGVNHLLNQPISPHDCFYKNICCTFYTMQNKTIL